MSQNLLTPTLLATRDTLEALSQAYAEPDWMRAARLEAWTLYQELPLPHSKEEAWRRTALSEYPLAGVQVAPPTGAAVSQDEPPTCWRYAAMAPDDHVSGSLVHCNGAFSYARLRSEDAAQGVIFDGLHQALQTHGDLIRRYWMRGVTARPDFNKFTALNAALWHGGTFVYAPAGARVSRPLQSLISYDAQGGTGLHHTLLIAEKGSHVTLIQERISQEERPELNAEVVELYAAEGAWVRYISLQHWGEQRYSVSVQEAQLQRNAYCMWISGAVGGAQVKDFMRTDMREEGARSLMRGYTFVGAKQHIDQSTYQHHRAPQTHSDLLFRNVLTGQARTVFYGMIRVENGANGAQGYQANHNLLLDAGHAHAIPGLEIAANDVKCSHGATVARLDPEQLFYLQARGIPRRHAESLMVQGFVRPITDHITLAHVRERLEDEVLRRFDERPA